jgi:hypothetical protein
MRDKEKVGLNEIIADFQVQVSISNILFLCPKKANLCQTKSVEIKRNISYIINAIKQYLIIDLLQSLNL